MPAVNCRTNAQASIVRRSQSPIAITPLENGDEAEWAAFLESRGVTLAARPKTHRDGARSCYLHDPDGNAVQIIYHPPISGA